MKIVNRTEFLQLPKGTLYSRYKPCYIEDLQIKGDTWTNDWLYQDLIGNLACNDSNEYHDYLQEAENTDCSLGLDFNCLERDGLYDEEQMFAVYEKEDIQGLINALKEHNKTVTKRKLIPKSIEVTTERKPFSTKVTATLSIKLELTQELTPKQIEYILTSHFKRL